MRRILRKVAKNSLELLGRFTVGNVVLEIAVDNNMAVGMVNGYRVVDGQLADDPMEKLVATLASIAAKLVRDNWGDGDSKGAITILPSEWDSAGKYPSARYMEAMVEKLREALDESTVVVSTEGAEKVEAPVVDPASRKIQIDLRQLIDNLTKYNQQVASCLKYADRAVERASIILARKVSSTMWGADKLQAQLDKVSAAIPVLEALQDPAARSAMLCSRSSEALISRIKKGIRQENEDTKYMKKVIIPDMLSSHDKVSAYLSTVVAALSSLSNLDRIVRVTTGYPASFMFKVSLIDDLNEAYTILVSFLADMPQMEKSIFEPLEYIQHGTFSK